MYGCMYVCMYGSVYFQMDVDVIHAILLMFVATYFVTLESSVIDWNKMYEFSVNVSNEPRLAG